MNNNSFNPATQRRETILFVRARLRQSESLRFSLQKFIAENINLPFESGDSVDFLEHITVAIDDELNDDQAHVIL